MLKRQGGLSCEVGLVGYFSTSTHGTGEEVDTTGGVVTTVGDFSMLTFEAIEGMTMV